MNKYKMITTHHELEKGGYELHHVYHVIDVLNKFDRVSFVKNVRHAGAMSLLNSCFITCIYLNKKAVAELKEVFSEKNLTSNYYEHKVGKYAADERCIGFSIGGFHLEAYGKEVYVSVQLSFEVIDKKPQFVIEFDTCSEYLHLEENSSIRSRDIDEFVKLVGDRVSYLIGLSKDLQKEYGEQPKRRHDYRHKKQHIKNNDFLAMLEEAPTISMKELEAGK